MHKRLSGHVRGNAVAYLALFVALGGTSAYAANTVFSEDIVDGEVKTPDLATDAVTRAKISNVAVGPRELAPGAVARKRLAADAVDGSKVEDGSLDADDIADNGSLGTNEINESTLFNDNSLNATDVADTSSLGTNEINEGSLGVVEGASTSRIRFGREQLSGAESGPSAAIFESGVANVNVEKNASNQCSLTLLNSPFGSTLTFVREVVNGTAVTLTNGTLGLGGSNSTGFFSSAVQVRWQAWVAGNPSSAARIVTVDASARSSGTTCDFSAVMTIGA